MPVADVEVSLCHVLIQPYMGIAGDVYHAKVDVVTMDDGGGYVQVNP
jgi:hypothetical protein